jgi:hypothetical protein
MSSVIKTNLSVSSAQSGDISVKTLRMYPNKFFGTRQAQTWKAAVSIVPKVLEMVQPTSVINLDHLLGV